MVFALYRKRWCLHIKFVCKVLGIKKKYIEVFAGLGIAWLGKGEKGKKRVEGER